MLLTLADFLDSLLHGATLVGLALALGGVAWGFVVLRGTGPSVPAEARRRCLTLTAFGALLAAAGQAAMLVLTVTVLRASLGRDPLGDLAWTAHFGAGALRTLLCLALAVVALRSRRASPRGWAVLAPLAVLVAAAGAWLTHATGRIEHRSALMALTVSHQVAAAVWLGGLVQLVGLWRLTRRDGEANALWPAAVARFSRLAGGAVVLLVATALPLAWTYTGSWRGLVGSGYGSLVILKALLLAAALVPGALNRSTARQANAPAAGPALRTRLPRLVEAETILLIVIVFTAAALSTQPPPADQSPAQQASVAEVAEVFRPKVPSLATPSVEAMRQSRAAMAAGAPRTREAYLWSNFSHNVAGLILFGMGLVAVAGSLLGAPWRRHWPLGFLALAAFIYLRAAANEGTWPFGSVALAQLDAEGLQHRMAAVLVIALGLFEWRARRHDGGVLAYVFPALGAVGGVLLLTHSHAAFQLKDSYLVQLTHSSMGALAGLLAAARWLELRLGPRPARVAGIAASAALTAIALVLVFYREANIVVG